MQHTFRQVAAFCGLRLSYYTTAALLAIVFFILLFTDYITATPLYILVAAVLLPGIIKSMFFADSKKRRNDMAFPLFCKKYHYNFLSSRALNISCFLLFILFAAWHISYRFTEEIPFGVTQLPLWMTAASLLLRLVGTLSYYLYFRLFPWKAMH